jgi:hypothetical protein
MAKKDKLKKELVKYIEDTDDEQILSLLKEDLIFYGNVKKADITDGLNKAQLKELKELAEEDDLKNTISLEEFKRATQKWRTK